jgi:hypothetical protein
MPESASARVLVFDGRVASCGFAFVPGHETVGIVDTIGPRAAAQWGWPRGIGWRWRCSSHVVTARRSWPPSTAASAMSWPNMYGFIRPARRAGRARAVDVRWTRAYGAGGPVVCEPALSVGRHRDRGGSRPLLEVMIRPRRSRADGIHRRRDHAAVVVRDVVGFVAFEHDAQPAHVWRGRHRYNFGQRHRSGHHRGAFGRTADPAQ